jgi:guanosine-3',5'-bis(diphosphate) 3'-pyrophosphohydrolase
MSLPSDDNTARSAQRDGGFDSEALAAILTALHFAADKHRDQRRKDAEASPYINHPIEVAELLARVGGVRDLVVLQAAILHDTIEDTQTTTEELDAHFGERVRRVVEEVTDDTNLPKVDRKRLQIEHAPHMSREARLVKLADKIANVIAVTKTPPAKWPLSRRKEYLDWTEAVVAGVRGSNPALETLYDEVLENGRKVLNNIPEE